MRVTNEMMVNSSLKRLSTRMESYERAQAQLATGKKLRTPSDDPAGANRALGLRAAMRTREQEARNANDAQAWLGLADSQLQGGVNRLTRGRELAVAAANSMDPGAREAAALEVENVRDELLAIANFKNRGRPLFAGFSSGDAVAQNPTTPPTYAYGGDRGRLERRVGDSETVAVNVTADDVFGFTAAAADPAKKNTFQALTDLAAQIRAGDSAAISASIASVDEALGHMTNGLSVVGVTANRVESAAQRSAENLLTLRGQLAEVEDTDLAEAVMELQIQETAYQATLQALGRSLPTTLAAFLR